MYDPDVDPPRADEPEEDPSKDEDWRGECAGQTPTPEHAHRIAVTTRFIIQNHLNKRHARQQATDESDPPGA